MSSSKVAVIGYGLRVPEAQDADAFWEIISKGMDVVTRASSNVGATASDRVHAYGLLEGFEQFDAEYFEYSPREAEDIDPQQRLLLHCAVEALESAGVSPKKIPYDIGVWAASGLSGYLLHTLDHSRSGMDATSQLMGGDGHYAATRISYKLGLTGPAMAVGSACSSSLLAIHSAAQAILNGETDLALAGGMDIEFPQPMSYLFQDGGILSSDGVCRPFDSAANGTVFGSGGGLVLLADLDTALKEGWPILAEIAGSAANNDGSDKASFSAPKPSRQADVISQALTVAELSPEDVGFIECHGTGTLLGDQSELEALASVFGHESGIVLGSAKANFGHLRVGAGVIGFIKACETIAHGEMAPMANLSHPVNAVAEHGFIVEPAAKALNFDQRKAAGVSSFGFGGTNVHVVLKQNSTRVFKDSQGSTDAAVILPVSSTSPDSCISNGIALSDFIERQEGIDLGSVSHTLCQGREHGKYRLAAIAADVASAVRGLHAAPDASVEGWVAEKNAVVFLFSGQGTSLMNLARGLWNWEPVFTEKLVELATYAGLDRTALAQAISGQASLPLGIEHALHVAVQMAIVAQLRARGVTEAYTAGYSLGEYAAAAVGGAVDEKAVIEVLLKRGEVLAQAPQGHMFMVASSPEEIKRFAPRTFTAARIGETRTLISCHPDSANEVRESLSAAGIVFIELDMGLPYHSPLLADAAEQFNLICQSAEPNVESHWIPTLNSSRSNDRAYWSRHLESTIDFRVVGKKLSTLTQSERILLIDFSDDGFLSRATSESISLNETIPLSLSGKKSDTRKAYLRVLSQLWVSGCDIHIGTSETATPELSQSMMRLPARRWECQPYLKASQSSMNESVSVKKGHRKVQREASIEKWVYQPSWTLKMRSPELGEISEQRWLVFTRNNPLSQSLVSRLESAGVDCVCLPIEQFTFQDDAAIQGIIGQLNLEQTPFDRIVHLWCSDETSTPTDLEPRLSFLNAELEQGFYTLLFALQEITERQGAHPLQLDIVAHGIHPLDSAESVPERALLLGASIVLPQDYPFITGRSIDISDLTADRLVDDVFDELSTMQVDHAVALFRQQRWVRTYERDVLPDLPKDEMPLRLRKQGVYLITGGLGGIGMTLAEFLVKQCQARLVLTGLESIPSDDSSDDPLICQRKEQIKKLEALGGQVLAVKCDAADPGDTARLLDEIDTRFGGLNGVIHAAGVFETQRAFKSIAETGREDCIRRLLPKVQGTLVLAAHLKGRKLDFVITQSSLSSQLGGLGFYAYTAGNAFMDAFTERQRNQDIPWMTVNWDGWIFRERGDDAPHQSVVSPSFASPDFGVVAEIAVRPSEGAEIYARLMHTKHPRQVLISTANFNERISQWVNSSHHEKTEVVLKNAQSWDDPVARKVADAWGEILGVDELQPESNFFAVGGDSLLGVSLAHRLSVEFNVVLSAITLFENATIDQMVSVIKKASHHSGKEIES
ncbi:type I polyketide synthase [Photobacterium galatheae]|uniref:Uncharacterized protein n=1 Tax=Photobacterium galatheae TaxID=1654360 RepID=A0A066RSZ3_9GAMM|nr:type I polyketide synthase [Photobacterium galatheae]KDM90807.1 hypothetical protein EA58_15590 [Photobacterium galatheae]MCM0149864.1 type I polyketide synthase [Photobacterium galatheae]